MAKLLGGVIATGVGAARPGAIEWEGEFIRSVGLRRLTHYQDAFAEGADRTILPGFIDVHNHGAVGVDVNSGTAEDLLRVAEFLAGNGVTAWVPTLVPDSDENYRRAIGEIDRLMEMQEGRAVARAVGVHYEGVFASAHMCGALRPRYFKTYQAGSTTGPSAAKNAAAATPHIREGSGEKHPVSRSKIERLPPRSYRKEGRVFEGLPKLKRGVHMMTMAPEVQGGIELIRDLARDGWVVAIGHTRADADTLDAAFEAGARHVTHFFNAMTGIHHRDLGVAGWALANPDVTIDIIADGVHVDGRMLDLACRAKSPSKVCLISDSVAPTGLGDGAYELWGEKLTVENGRTRNERGGIAGSVITMADAARRMMSLGYSMDDIAAMSSGNPARLLGLEGERGTLAAGKRADVVVPGADGGIQKVLIGGVTVGT